MLRRRMPSVCVSLAVIGVLLCVQADAFDACAVSPDGKQCVAGGDNRALVVYDTAKWEVVKKAWVGPRVKRIEFTADGSQCVVTGDDRAVYLYNTADWKLLRTMDYVCVVRTARKAAVAVGVLAEGTTNNLVIWSVPAWTEVREVELPAKRTMVGAAITDDGRTAYVRTDMLKDDAEKANDPGPQPASGDGETKRGLRRQRNDGWINEVYIVDVVTGKLSRTITCFDRAFKYDMLPTAKGVICAMRSQYWGRIDAAAGTYEILFTDVSVDGFAQAPSGEILGGRSESFLVMSADGKKLAKCELSEIPGEEEVVTAFAPLGDAQMIAVTDAWRVLVIDVKTRRVVREVQYY